MHTLRLAEVRGALFLTLIFVEPVLDSLLCCVGLCLMMRHTGCQGC